MAYEHILVEREGPITIVTLNRPQVYNALHKPSHFELEKAFDDFSADPDQWVAIVTGAGDKAFSAGNDLKYQAAGGERGWGKSGFGGLHTRFDCDKPIIAAVNGFAMGGGFEVALACDITVAAEGTRFGEPEVRFGTGIVAMLLPWAVLPKHAKEMLLTGNDKMDAARAHAIGIVNHVVPEQELLAFGRRMALDIAAAAGPSVLFTKRAINRTYEIMGMRDALRASLDIDVILNSAPSAEKDEFQRIRKADGLKAALAWRDARFSDGKKN